jgi:hypothetical protein
MNNSQDRGLSTRRTILKCFFTHLLTKKRAFMKKMVILLLVFLVPVIGLSAMNLAPAYERTSGHCSIRLRLKEKVFARIIFKKRLSGTPDTDTPIFNQISLATGVTTWVAALLALASVVPAVMGTLSLVSCLVSMIFSLLGRGLPQRKKGIIGFWLSFSALISATVAIIVISAMLRNIF